MPGTVSIPFDSVELNILSEALANLRDKRWKELAEAPDPADVTVDAIERLMVKCNWRRGPRSERR